MYLGHRWCNQFLGYDPCIIRISLSKEYFEAVLPLKEKEWVIERLEETDQRETQKVRQRETQKVRQTERKKEEETEVLRKLQECTFSKEGYKTKPEN